MVAGEVHGPLRPRVLTVDDLEGVLAGGPQRHLESLAALCALAIFVFKCLWLVLFCVICFSCSPQRHPDMVVHSLGGGEAHVVVHLLGHVPSGVHNPLGHDAGSAVGVACRESVKVSISGG